MEAESRHQCLVYSGAPSEKLQSIAVIVQRKISEGYRCLYLNSVPMVSGIRSTLSAIGIDVSTEIEKGRLILSSETVASDEDFNSRAMLDKLEDFLDSALADGYKGLWATGDMAWEFGEKQDFSKLLEYELGLEDLFRRRKELCGICQYHTDILPKEAVYRGLLTHPTLFVNETLSQINPHYLNGVNSVDTNPSVFEMDKLIMQIGSR